MNIFLSAPYFFRTYGLLLGIQLVLPLKFSLPLGFVFSLPFALYGPFAACGFDAWGYNFLLGYLLSLPFVLVVYSGTAVGALGDMLRGHSLGEVINPFGKSIGAPSGMLIQSMIQTVLIQCSALPYLLSVLARSFALFPLEFNNKQQHLTVFFDCVVKGIGSPFKLFLPFSILCLLVEWLFALLTKLLPQSISFSSELYLAKSALLFAALIVALSAVEPAMVRKTLTGSYTDILYKQ
jgi:flagellar biosynthesis protein FliR